MPATPSSPEEYNPDAGEERFYSSTEHAVEDMVEIVGAAVLVFRMAEALPCPSVHERAQALRGIVNALTQAQEPIDKVLADGFLKAAEMEREG